ncbi:ABC transporter permease [Homoserinibacter sp. GY 40078]|uniref:ABC transporter permease n=1 Tax=Homoserinibacter sp. GY 40078 TaxID=2603275 RepID=UPI0011CB6BFF|nr:ABC transporter permease [Homoserinibacter sp. GY 40078]TXK19544.1 ABC transporter permease [Homoserinibacter sp. GY 40078]
MSPRLTLATAGRILTQVRHDPRTIVLLLVVPALLVGLIAWIFDDTPVFDEVGPAMLGLFPFIVMFLVTSITTLRERRSGTLERLLALPLGKGDLIGGYALAFGLLATLQALVAVAWAVWVCGLSVEGEVWLLVVVAVVNGLLGTMLGLLASAFAANEFQVVQFMPLVVAPQVLLGGIFLARDEMPDVLHAISDWLPLSYSVDALSLVSSESDATGDVLLDLLVVGVFALGALVLAALTLRRRTR